MDSFVSDEGWVKSEDDLDFFKPRQFNSDNNVVDTDKPRQLLLFENFPLYQFKTKLPKRFCDEIDEYYSDQKPQDAALGDSMYTDDQTRSVNVRWCNQDDWVGPFLYQYIQQANHHLFQYDITGLYYNNIHHLEYKEGHFHSWHIDNNGCDSVAFEPPCSRALLNLPKQYCRKLSFTLQLSDPEDYTGGELEIEVNSSDDPKKTVTLDKDRGTLGIFDPRTRHRISPVKSGTRKALVGWAIGPRWR
tara:strand:- start:1229 stop:1966 length:738 start_codon:yes stop_codon:yes gene_type:complete